MANEILGIHHVTAIASDPQRNVDFYTGVLGLRLIKVTVNFDMPESYHFYYGDAIGSPGTILTFFSWEGARPGRIGAGQVTTTSFAVPEDSLGYWTDRLRQQGISVSEPYQRFGAETIRFADPDGLQLELVGHTGMATVAWEGAEVPAERAIRGFQGVTLSGRRSHQSAQLLGEGLGFQPIADEGNVSRFSAGRADSGQFVDLVHATNEPTGSVSVGTVHHVAWRTPSDDEQIAWQQALLGQGHQVTPVRDRQYFHSIYFVEPSGVLFEIATDPPGFAVDESVAELGRSLKLPPWLEPRRAELEAVLPPIRR
jgi:catechol 2,3-dioxygenase-like lactoylglutathione lyase family enzyme